MCFFFTKMVEWKGTFNTTGQGTGVHPEDYCAGQNRKQFHSVAATQLAPGRGSP